MNDAQKDRLFELLSDDALGALSVEEQTELNDLKKQFPEWENDFSHELAAAAIGLSSLNAKDALPANLRTKILSDADDYFSRAAERSAPDNSSFAADAPRGAIGNANIDYARDDAPKTSFFGQWLGWTVAAAACVALAINLWLTHSQTETAKNPEPLPTAKPVQTSTPNIETTNALSTAQQREQLLASAPDVVKINLKAAKVKSFENLSGEVVWSNARQKGFVRLRNLPANDAAKESYQLWIFDAARNVKTPVSGGVFNVRSAGEIIIPVNAQLEIKQPTAFAVTREKAGGVVVSSPERVVASGKI